MRVFMTGQRTRKFVLGILWAALCWLPVKAGEGRPNVAVANGFEVQMWVVDGEWWQATDFAEIPREAYLTRIERKKKPDIVFLLRNPALDDEGNSNVTARVLIRRPDGSILREDKRLPLWTIRKPFPRNVLSHGRWYADMPLTDGDPSGDYTIEATVTDNVTRAALQVRGVLKIEQAAPAH